MLSSLAILFWNVRGISADSKCAVVKELISNSDCSIIYIQETKWQTSTIFRLGKICNDSFTNASFNDSHGASGQGACL
jgi:exonuclease III